ncbi:MAG: type II secretion system protein [Eubacteriales bacterium]
MKQFHENSLQQNHGGYSLFELVISIAIFGIISASVLQFMVVSSQSFASVNAAVELDQKSQLAMSNIKEAVIEANGTLWLKDDTLYVFSSSMEPGVTQDIVHCYHHEGDEIIYVQYLTDVTDRTVSATGDVTTGKIEMTSQVGHPEVLVDGVTDFTFTTSQDQYNEIEYLDLSMTVTERGQAITTHAQITLRNTLKFAVDPSAPPVTTTPTP